MIKLKELLLENSSDEYKKDWLERHRAQFTEDGRLIAFHGTTPKTARIVKKTGFRSGSYFSLDANYSRRVTSIYHDIDESNVVVFKVYLPMDAIDFIMSDIVSTRFIDFKETL